MLDHVLVRLRQLEQRVTEIESRLDPGSAGSGLHVPPPPPLPPAARIEASEPATEPRVGPAPPPLAPAVASRLEPPPLPPQGPGPAPRRTDLEHFVGLKVLGRAGACALLLAAAYFGQLGWAALGPAGRVSLVYGAGLLMVAAGFLLRTKVTQYYTAVLWGGGTSLTYAAGALASLRFELVSGLPAMLLLLGSAALGQFLARILRLEAFATLALAGAYAAPVLVGSPSPTPTLFFALLLLLHTWAAWTERSWSWHAARGLAVVATVVLAVGWYTTNGRVSTVSFVLHVEALVIALAAPELLTAFLRAQVARERWWLAASGLWFAQGLLLFDTWRHSEWTGFGLVAGALSLAGGALLAARSKTLAPPITRLGSVLLAFGALVVWQGVQWPIDSLPGRAWVRIASLGAVATALMGLRRWILVGELGACLAGALALGVVLVQGAPTTASRLQAVAVLVVPAVVMYFGRPSASAVCSLLLGCGATFFGLCQRLEFGGPEAHWLPIAFAATGAFATFGAVQAGLRRDHQLLATAAAVLAALVLGWMALVLGPAPAGVAAPLQCCWNPRWASVVALFACLVAGLRATPREEVVARRVLAVAMLAVCYLGGLMELLDLIADWPGGWSDVATSLYSLAFAGGLLVAGFLRQRADLRWSGLLGFGVVVVKVGLHDLRTLDTPLRVLATGVLGLVMLVGAFAYGRTRGAAR